MINNPYKSPGTLPTKARDEPYRRPAERPLGVTILAVLQFLGGILILVSQCVMLLNLTAIEKSLEPLGVSVWMLLGGVLFLAFLSLASSIGMWTGAKWGWWVASFNDVYGLFRNGSAMATVVGMADQLEGASRGVEYYRFKHGLRMVFGCLILLYLFKGNVLEFFDLEALSKGKAIGILVGICLVIMAVMWAVQLVSG